MHLITLLDVDVGMKFHCLLLKPFRLVSAVTNFISFKRFLQNIQYIVGSGECENCSHKCFPCKSEIMTYLQSDKVR